MSGVLHRLQERTQQISEPAEELYASVRVRHEVRGMGKVHGLEWFFTLRQKKDKGENTKVETVDFENARGKPYTVR